jgi:UDP-N-acetylmuramoyl-tripeptide--D-alanyl-D-alanine ligase
LRSDRAFIYDDRGHERSMRIAADDLAALASGRLVRRGSRDSIDGAFIDSRSPRAGGLFVPIVAARDGHAFLGQAIAAGAAAVLVQHGQPAPAGDVTIVEVDDTLAALQRLAAHSRTRVHGPVVCITGSNGKTTTRGMIDAVLSGSLPDVLCTQGNLNNHLGVPLTLLGEPHDPSAMVVELGMSAPGENDALAAIVQPTIAVVTSIALEHLEFMGSIEAIAAAEAEPLQHVGSGGAIVVPSDEPLLAPYLPGSDGPEVLTFGHDAHANVRILRVSQGEHTRARLAVREAGGEVTEIDLELRTFGLHNAHNAAAAIAVGLRCGLPLPSMVDALAGFEPVGDRGRTLVLGPHMIIADSYNANPGSVAAALQSLAALPAGPRKIAVLGDMLELGPRELELHGDVGRLCGALGLHGLVAIGRCSRAIAQEAANAGVDVLATDDIEAASAWVAAHAGEGAAVLVKGSRGMRLERVIEALVARWQPPR